MSDESATWLQFGGKILKRKTLVEIASELAWYGMHPTDYDLSITDPVEWAKIIVENSEKGVPIVACKDALSGGEPAKLIQILDRERMPYHLANDGHYAWSAGHTVFDGERWEKACGSISDGPQISAHDALEALKEDHSLEGFELLKRVRVLTSKIPAIAVDEKILIEKLSMQQLFVDVANSAKSNSSPRPRM